MTELTHGPHQYYHPEQKNNTPRAVSVLYALSGILVPKPTLYNLAKEVCILYRTVYYPSFYLQDLRFYRYAEPTSQGNNYHYYVVLKAMAEVLGLTYTLLPNSKQLESQNDVDIDACVLMPGFRGFLVITGTDTYLVYTKIHGSMYNCDHSLQLPVELPRLREQIKRYICTNCLCLAVFGYN